MRGNTWSRGTVCFVALALWTAGFVAAAAPASAAQLPNLGVASFSGPPALAPGDKAVVADRTANRGNGRAGRSTTSFFLSKDRVVSADDLRLRPGRPIRKLDGGARSKGDRTVSIPKHARPGQWHLIACADGHDDVRESSENDNCLTAAGGVEVVRPGVEPPHLNLTPDSLDFGTLAFTQTASRTFTATNPGPYTFGIEEILTSGVGFHAPDSGCTNKVMYAGSTCTGVVTATGISGGSFQGELRLEFEGGDVLASAPLAYTATPPAAQPTLSAGDSTVNFPGVVVGSTSKPEGVYFFNAGEGTTGNVITSLTGADADQFQINTNGCAGETMSSGAQCVIEVVFAPTSGGTKTATVTATASPGGSATVQVQGQGDG